MSAYGGIKRDKTDKVVSDLENRFNQKVLKLPSGCWLWMGATDPNGYGNMRAIHKYDKAHRIAFTIYKGEIEPGKQLDHLCRIPGCVNPDHLELVTSAENTRRGTLNLVRREKATLRTHCPHGHPYSGENLYLDKHGWKQCKTCTRERNRRRYRGMGN